MKRTPADEWFSKCVRERADWTCEKCGKKYAENSQGLHCSHNYSRRHRTIRWHGDNALALCYSCHQWYGGNPVESGDWLKRKMGMARLDTLVGIKNMRYRISKEEEKEIAKHYREQLAIMKKKRLNGEVGYLEFVSYQ